MQRYHRILRASGLELDDAVQHLIVVFAARLQGQSPFDPSRTSLKNYLFLLTRSVLSNQAEKRHYRMATTDALACQELHRAELVAEDMLVQPRSAQDWEVDRWASTPLDAPHEVWRLLGQR